MTLPCPYKYVKQLPDIVEFFIGMKYLADCGGLSVERHNLSVVLTSRLFQRLRYTYPTLPLVGTCIFMGFPIIVRDDVDAPFLAIKTPPTLK
jgi:hypothetical protein